MRRYLQSAEKVIETEEKVNATEKRLRDRHIKRLTEEKCTSLAGIIFLDLVSNLERVSDHAANIAYTTLGQEGL